MGIPLRTVSALLIFGLAGSFQVGYHSSIYNQPQAVMEKFIAQSYIYQFGKIPSVEHVTIIWSLAIGVFAIGALCSDLFVQYTLDSLGRKGSIYIAAALSLIGACFQVLAYTFNLFQLLIIGRVFTGMGANSGTNAQLIFFSEIAPTKIRGTAGATIHVFAVLGTIMANLVGFPQVLGSEDRWAYLLLVVIVILLIFLAVSWKFPESPKSLVVNRNRADLAIESLAFYNHNLDGNLEELLKTIHDESHAGNFQATKWRIANLLIFLEDHKSFRCSALFLICLSISIPLCGYFVMLNFAAYILTRTGLSNIAAQYGATLYCFVDLFTSILNLWLIECKGRRGITLTGAWVTFSCLMGIFVCQALEEYSVAVPKLAFTVVSILALLIHAIGKASLVCGHDALKGELFPSFLRATTVIYCSSIFLNGTNIFLSTVYLPLERKIGCFALLILFVIPMFVLGWVLTIMCPETKGKHVSHIVQETMDLENEAINVGHDLDSESSSP